MLEFCLLARKLIPRLHHYHAAETEAFGQAAAANRHAGAQGEAAEEEAASGRR
jgi:hypothetical protein